MARHGSGSALVLAGQAGIGKTRLLQEAAEMASGFTILSTVGCESETGISYAHLADALRPVLSELPNIPTRQAAALSSALAIGPAESADRFVVAAATLSVLASAAADTPVLLLVDDCQWVDAASREAFAFASRRLIADGIVALFAVRNPAEARAGFERLPRLDVGGLDETSCRRLIRSVVGPISPQAARRLIDSSGRNPLALINLPALISAEQIEAWTRSDAPLPIDTLLAQVFGHSINLLPASTRSALSILAVVDAGPCSVLPIVLERFGLSIEDLEPAEDHALIITDDGGPRFRHPLIRSAAYQGASPRERRRAHLAMAETLATAGAPAGPERRAAHLLAAGVASDPELADILDTEGQKALSVQNFPSARLLLERSARLTRPGEMRAQRLIRGVHAARLSGAISEAQTLVADAQREPTTDPVTSTVLGYLRCRLDIWVGDLLNGRDQLAQLARSAQEMPSTLRAFMLTDVALASIELGDMTMGDQASADALRCSAGAIDDAELQIIATRLLAQAIRGDDALLVTLGQRSDQVDALEPVTFDATEQLLLVIGLAYLACEAVEESHRVLSRAVNGARQQGAIGALPFRLGRLAWSQCWRGDWAQAHASADEVLTLSTETGWHGERTNGLLALAKIEGLTGQRADSRTHALEARELAAATRSRSYQAMADAVLGSAALAAEDYPEAVERFARVQAFADTEGVVDNPMLWWSGELIESLVRCDREPEARVCLAGFAARPASTTRPVSAAVLSRCRALLDPGKAESHLREALRLHSKGQMPFEQARTELQLGRYLRRQRRPEARDLLQAALGTFDRLGAVDWAEKSRVELRAAGVRMAPPEAGLELLTPQELQVSLGVGRGMTNREVAAHLFLSVKTVEYHLSKTYAKLGVTNRTQLVGVVGRSSPDRTTS